MMLLFSSAYQHLLSRSQTSCCFPSVYNFPIHLHTCFLIYIGEKIQYYAIHLSWSNVQFWLPTILIFFCSVCNGWQPNWKPLTTHAFCWRENSYAREVYVINYSFPLSVANGGYYVYYPLNTFQHMGKMFMNSLLFMVWEFHFSVFSEMILWAKETCSFFCNNNTTLSILN